MTRSEIIKYLILRTVGNFLVLFAIFGVLATFGPVLYCEANYEWDRLTGVYYKVAGQTKIASGNFGNKSSFSSSGLASVISGQKEKILVPVDTNFDILIPKLGANARVFPNVDPSKPSDYLPLLQKGVAHAKGTVFPGQKGNIYLFAHSTDNFWDVGRYNAVFYLLGNLSAGDEIVIFYQGVRHNYIVYESGIEEGSDVSYIMSAKTGTEQLVLQTCWPPGTTWKRLLVFAKPK